ncbi:MAG: hypothetical protein ABFD15_06630 [Methanofastidiosum sp.]
MRGLKSDYKSDHTAPCDNCGNPTYNRCGSSGMIICDDCGNKHPKTTPKPRKISNAISELEL